MQKGYKSEKKVTDREVATYLRSDAVYRSRFRIMIGGSSLFIGTVVTILLALTFAHSSHADPGALIELNTV